MTDLSSQAEGYRFTADWFVKNMPVFESVLSPLAGKPNLHFLEIGSYEGRSACWFLDHILTHPSSCLTCIEPFSWGSFRTLFNENIRRAGREDSVRVIAERSNPALLALHAERFDCIYIDGDHGAPAVLFDVVVAFSLLQEGGIMIMDDYLLRDSLFGGNKLRHPKVAIDAFLRMNKERIEVLHKGYAVAIRKKSP